MLKKLFMLFLLSVLFSCSQGNTLDIKRGDLTFHGFKEATLNSPKGQIQSRIYYMESWALNVDLYKSLDFYTTKEMQSYDNTDFFMPGKYQHWFAHTDMIYTDGILPEGTGGDFIIIARFKPEVNIDLEAMIEKHQSFKDNSYNQPLIYVVNGDLSALDWSNRLTCGSDNRVSYSECQDEYCHTDMADPLFWTRDKDCSSAEMWAIMYGLGAGDIFAGDLNRANAVDAISPGQLLWWLMKNGLVEVVTVIEN